MDGILMVKAIKAIHADCTLKETGRSWTLPFSNFCPFGWGLLCHAAKKTPNWESSFMQLANLLSQEQEWAKWEEQQRQSQRNHANQLAELKCCEDELAWQRMKSEHELERMHNGELVQMQE